MNAFPEPFWFRSGTQTSLSLASGSPFLPFRGSKTMRSGLGVR